MDLNIELMRRCAETPEAADRRGLEAAAIDLADAFASDPLLSWVSRTDTKRDAARAAFFQFILRELVWGVGEILRPSVGGAAAVWMPSEKLGPNPLIKELAAIPIILRLCGWSRLPRFLKMRAALDDHHPMERPHDYLFMLGVSPAAQGRGIGSRLLKFRTDQLDAARRPAFLETATEANVRLYRRHGFEVINHYRPEAAGPLVWAMWREPRAAI
jgi:ribosomal protein S18 acetylase RimI-like enzyme